MNVEESEIPREGICVSDFDECQSVRSDGFESTFKLMSNALDGKKRERIEKLKE